MDEEATLRTLKAYRSVIDELVDRHRGRVFGRAGDSLVAEFASPVEAVRCATDIQRRLAAQNAALPEARRMPFRIGVHLGDVMVDDGDLLGDGVNVASRLEALAEPGGIYISRTVYDQVHGRLSLDLEDLGETALKNIAEPVRVYRVEMAAEERQGRQSQAVPAALVGPDKPSIAVLPFENMSGDPDQEYFADGIADDIITALSKFRWFFVTARNSSFTYKGEAVDVKRVARELGVRYVLEGSVRRSGTRVRVNVQFIDATTGHHVWAERYDRELVDIFAVQDEITERVATSVGPEFYLAELHRAQHKDVRNLDAWDLVLRGCSLYWWHTRAGNVEAQHLFRQAIELEANNVMALSMLAFSEVLDALNGWSDAPARSISEAERHARAALASDNQEPTAYLALGYVELIARWHDMAIGRIRRAIDLNPNFASAYGVLGLALAYAGESDQAGDQIQHAIRLSPRDPFMANRYAGMALAAFVSGRYEEAVEWAVMAVGEKPDLLDGHRMLAVGYGQLDQIADARSALVDVLRLAPRLSAGDVRKQLPFKRPADLERYLDGLRRAGLAD